jgi:hypothetical protein
MSEKMEYDFPARTTSHRRELWPLYVSQKCEDTDRNMTSVIGRCQRADINHSQLTTVSGNPSWSQREKRIYFRLLYSRKLHALRNHQRGGSLGSSLWSPARSRWHCAKPTSAVTNSFPQHDRVTAKWQISIPSRTPSTLDGTHSSGRASGVSSTRAVEWLGGAVRIPYVSAICS